MKTRNDIELAWGKVLIIIVQAGAVYSLINSLMLIGIFYTTTARPEFGIPLWLYLLVVTAVIFSLVIFILKIGISGYYRFFNQQSAMDKIDQKVDRIIKHLGMKDGL